MSLRCYILGHDWNHNKGLIFEVGNYFKRRTCKRCGKVKENCYDMSYGETTWREIE